jgi:hypothetical protein
MEDERPKINRWGEGYLLKKDVRFPNVCEGYLRDLALGGGF